MKSDFTEGHVPDYFLAVCLEKSHWKEDSRRLMEKEG